MPFVQLLPLSVTSPATHKQIWPFWCQFPRGWACVHSRIPWVPPMDSPGREFSLAATIPIGFYSQRFWGFISPYWNSGMHSLSHSPVVPPALLALKCGPAWATSCHLSRPVHQPPWLTISVPSTSLYECFFFNSFVGFPYSSIFWQFWLYFFVFEFIVIFLLVVWGSKAYLPTPPSWP